MNGPPWKPARISRRWAGALLLAGPVLLALAVLALTLYSPDAFARAGGGSSFSSGGGSSSGGSRSYSSGGSNSGGGDAVAGLIWLVVQYPAIGVPVVVVILVVTVWQKSQQREFGGRSVSRSEQQPYVEVAPRGPRVNLAPLLQADPGFSLPLFLDLARLVYTRAMEEGARLDVMSAWLSPAARQVVEQFVGRDSISGVCIGSTALVGLRATGQGHQLSVQFVSNVLRTPQGGRPVQHVRTEQWTFARRSGVLSPGPDRMQELRCPSCGNPSEARRDGTCTRCDTVINDGRLQWVVQGIEVRGSKQLPGLGLSLGGGVEAGTERPTRPDPDLGANLRRLIAVQPDFDAGVFGARVRATFLAIQNAWSAGRLYDLRPLESDFLYQQHRYWLERYAQAGVRNRAQDVEVRSLVLVKVTVDAYVVSVTLRLFVSMLDWTEDRERMVVGGSKDDARVFSEYWTFVRSLNARPGPASGSGSPAGIPTQCPSCGAALDRVNEAGICGYCEAKITSGAFDWVLSDIQQDEVWSG
ncbi:MAG: hypothetical protein EXR69_09985 [Myxococcales bacterium]|nr:hypothetical protein [Myxococcales bacterium]